MRPINCTKDMDCHSISHSNMNFLRWGMTVGKVYRAEYLQGVPVRPRENEQGVPAREKFPWENWLGVPGRKRFP